MWRGVDIDIPMNEWLLVSVRADIPTHLTAPRNPVVLTESENNVHAAVCLATTADGTYTDRVWAVAIYDVGPLVYVPFEYVELWRPMPQVLKSIIRSAQRVEPCDYIYYY